MINFFSNKKSLSRGEQNLISILGFILTLSNISKACRPTPIKVKVFHSNFFTPSIPMLFQSPHIELHIIIYLLFNIKKITKILNKIDLMMMMMRTMPMTVSSRYFSQLLRKKPESPSAHSITAAAQPPWSLRGYEIHTRRAHVNNLWTKLKEVTITLRYRILCRNRQFVVHPHLSEAFEI